MDIALLEQALRLQAEVEKAGLDANEPDFAALVKQLKAGTTTSTGANGNVVVKAPEPPNASVAAEFMLRGAALAGAAAESNAPDGKALQAERERRQQTIGDMLRMGSAPLPEFDPKALLRAEKDAAPETAPPGNMPTPSLSISAEKAANKKPSTKKRPNK